ncbi:polysaccharide deacetylase family protein [Streptomyces armeniacus]|uniref:Polysaccharide deacetylase family protein n=1 Tax=Streptomyces armeniacus TaxID=83291 RepID=A0A345XK76_9ACTN|nr:polysaccharide deacetylase family protein [Streptomyces armeniacus]AXK32042.1 polysaccharide deacetylase family protein [Streptomyces armeniacus]
MPWRASRRALLASTLALLTAVAPAVDVRAAGTGVPPDGAGPGAHPAADRQAGPLRPLLGPPQPLVDDPRPGPGEAAPKLLPEAAPAAPGLALASAQRSQALSSAQALASHAERVQQRLAAYRRWGLKRPLPAPAAPPALKPRVRDAKVVSRVPTDDKVIFLTIDDGTVKDPEFLDLVREMDLPVTSFLTDEESRPGAGYEYFRELERLGGTTHNHTLHHPFLPALSYKRQRKEICGQQENLKREFGGPEPRLFRPPYGEYDKDTLRAARKCGVDAVVLWGMEAWADRVDFQEPGRRLYPGAIILTHYRGPAEWGDGGTMADMTRRLLRLAADQGYSVGRLEDYL